MKSGTRKESSEPDGEAIAQYAEVLNTLVDNQQFDDMVGSLSGWTSRRTMARAATAGVFALLGLSQAEGLDIKAKKKKKKKKKKNKGRCTSAYGAKLTCSPGAICCDPATSTIAACTEPGWSVCCSSSGYAHPDGSTCCTSVSSGQNGYCGPAYPNCCSARVGAGCCAPGFPVCCDFDCCPVGDFCAPDGYCFYSFRESPGGVISRARIGGRRVRPDARGGKDTSRELHGIGA